MANTTPRPAKKTATRPAASRASTASHPPGRKAAASVARAEHLAVTLPILGPVQLPRPAQLAYYTGIGALVALEILEWPAALALGIGHALISQQRNRTIKEFGEALEDA